MGQTSSTGNSSKGLHKIRTDVILIRVWTSQSTFTNSKAAVACRYGASIESSSHWYLDAGWKNSRVFAIQVVGVNRFRGNVKRPFSFRRWNLRSAPLTSTPDLLLHLTLNLGNNILNTYQDRSTRSTLLFTTRYLTLLSVAGEARHLEAKLNSWRKFLWHANHFWLYVFFPLVVT